MNDKFDIIEYLSGLTGYVFDKAVLKRIAFERHVWDVENFEEIDSQTRDLLKADLLYTAYISPNTWGGTSVSHGSFSKSISSQSISPMEKDRLYKTIVGIYRKYDDEKLEEVEKQGCNLQWLDF